MLLSREAHEQRVDELTQLTLTLTLTLTRGAHEQRVDERGARVKGVEQGRPQKWRRALAISREHRQPASAALVRILRQQRLRLRRCRGGAEAVQRRCRGGAEAVQRRCRRVQECRGTGAHLGTDEREQVTAQEAGGSHALCNPLEGARRGLVAAAAGNRGAHERTSGRAREARGGGGEEGTWHVRP